MASHPNERIFQINQKVRERVRKRLSELEDIIVSIAIDTYKDIINGEPDDPFDCLKNTGSVYSDTRSDKTQHIDTFLYDEDEDEEDEEVSVTTRMFDGILYYTFLEDEGNELRGVHERIVNDDESEVGDLAGYVDEQDRFWKAIKRNGKIEEYFHDQDRVPAKTNTIMRYPDLDSLNKNR